LRAVGTTRDEPFDDEFKGRILPHEARIPNGLSAARGILSRRANDVVPLSELSIRLSRQLGGNIVRRLGLATLRSLKNMDVFAGGYMDVFTTILKVVKPGRRTAMYRYHMNRPFFV
jgi:hypothetical protein